MTFDWYNHNGDFVVQRLKIMQETHLFNSQKNHVAVIFGCIINVFHVNLKKERHFEVHKFPLSSQASAFVGHYARLNDRLVSRGGQFKARATSGDLL